MSYQKQKAVVSAMCLLLLLGVEISSLKVQDLENEMKLLARLSPLPEPSARLAGVGFAFDPSFGPFLEGVRSLTPADAVVAIAFPVRHELYFYQAAYTLAPRQLVRIEEQSRADYVAIYANSATSPLHFTEIPSGLVAKLR